MSRAEALTALYSAGPMVGGATWADIEADRRGRGLSAPVTRLMRVPKAKVVTFKSDARLPSNVAVHIEPPRALPGYTRAQAAKARKVAMQACPCRLCALALAPPLTFADAVKCGTAEIGPESKAMLHGSHRFPDRETKQPKPEADNITG